MAALRAELEAGTAEMKKIGSTGERAAETSS